MRISTTTPRRSVWSYRVGAVTAASIGGVALHGGFGVLTRKYGLTAPFRHTLRIPVAGAA
jgi:hypothetical protein